MHYTDAPGEQRWLVRRRGIPHYVGDLKVCRRCEHAKPPSDFPRCASRTDGLEPYCRTCVAERKAERKARTPDLVREQARRHVAAYRARRCQPRAYVAWKDRPFITDLTIAKQQARMRLHYAIRAGKITRPDRCNTCGTVGPVDGHHARGYDGDAAYDVDWLCRRCHLITHGSTPRQEATHAVA